MLLQTYRRYELLSLFGTDLEETQRVFKYKFLLHETNTTANDNNRTNTIIQQ